ncbi:MAG TPA: pectinesterase family protein [Bryobacteraceae bacterium]|nr:pectinesterase family protein [Bryobacteraceae bacterium]
MMRLLVLFAAAPALAAVTPIHVVVAQDGSGDFPTVQNAVDHVMDRVLTPFTGRVIIELRPGVYHERVRIPADRPRITLRGEDAARTVISYSVGAKDVGGTFFSAVVDVNAPEFEGENITFQNNYGVGTQAVAISVHSDRAVFRHCRFLGMQDTLYAASGRQYYVDCYIAGHVDFIFGDAQAVFERCEIQSLGPGYIAAVSRTMPGGPEGFVFDHCRLTASPGVEDVYLGRPWRLFSRVVYLNCWMGGQIRPEGWDNWKKPEAEKDSYFAEFGSDGPGAAPAARVAWAHALTAAEAAQFRAVVFLRGSDGWNPTGHK